jgi:transposase
MKPTKCTIKFPQDDGTFIEQVFVSTQEAAKALKISMHTFYDIINNRCKFSRKQTIPLKDIQIILEREDEIKVDERMVELRKIIKAEKLGKLQAEKEERSRKDKEKIIDNLTKKPV